MLAIRLSRRGKKHDAHYRVVVLEKRSKRDGKTVANLGYWWPKGERIEIDKKAYETWVAKGAQPSAAVRELVGR